MLAVVFLITQNSPSRTEVLLLMIQSSHCFLIWAQCWISKFTGTSNCNPWGSHATTELSKACWLSRGGAPSGFHTTPRRIEVETVNAPRGIVNLAPWILMLPPSGPIFLLIYIPGNVCRAPSASTMGRSWSSSYRIDCGLRHGLLSSLGLDMGYTSMLSTAISEIAFTLLVLGVSQLVWK